MAYGLTIWEYLINKFRVHLERCYARHVEHHGAHQIEHVPQEPIRGLGFRV